MKQITIDGKEYACALKNRNVKVFEKDTGISIFKIDDSNIGSVSFTDISDLCFNCIEGIDEDEFDDLSFHDVIEVFKDIISGKKQKPQKAAAKTSND